MRCQFGSGVEWFLPSLPNVMAPKTMLRLVFGCGVAILTLFFDFLVSESEEKELISRLKN